MSFTFEILVVVRVPSLAHTKVALACRSSSMHSTQFKSGVRRFVNRSMSTMKPFKPLCEHGHIDCFCGSVLKFNGTVAGEAFMRNTQSL